MTILEPSDGWTNPFTRPTTPTIGRVVLYHADTDVTWPAIISEVRGINMATGDVIPPNGSDRMIKEIEDNYQAISIQANLTIFRPGRTEWKWCVQGDAVANWSWPVIKP